MVRMVKIMQQRHGQVFDAYFTLATTSPFSMVRSDLLTFNPELII